MIAQLRGAQAGFLAHGYWLSLPFTGQASGPGLTRTPVTAATVAQIRAAVVHPVLAAGVALALLAGINTASLNKLRVESIPACASYVRVPYLLASGYPDRMQTFFVPPAARPLLRTAQHYCLAHCGPEYHKDDGVVRFSPGPPPSAGQPHHRGNDACRIRASKQCGIRAA